MTTTHNKANRTKAIKGARKLVQGGRSAKYVDRFKTVKEYMENNSGKISDGDWGFMKIDTNPETNGDCIQKNCEKLAELWGKIPSTRETLHLRYYVFEYDGVKIRHASIVDLKNNRMIDVSNGRTRLMKLEFYHDVNSIVGYYDFSYDEIMNAISQEINGSFKYEGNVECISLILRKVMNCCFNRKKIKKPSLRRIMSRLFGSIGSVSFGH
jgi:hypothetical protein